MRQPLKKVRQVTRAGHVLRHCDGAAKPQRADSPRTERAKPQRSDAPRTDRAKPQRPDAPRGPAAAKPTFSKGPRAGAPPKGPRLSAPRSTSPRSTAPRSGVPRTSGPRPNAPREEGAQRIAKLLARAGVASRRDVERMIEDGRVAIDGTVLTTPATLLETLNGVTVDGKQVAPAEATRLFLFHKPTRTLTAANDDKGRATIYDRLPKGLPRLMPVGRLDYNTEGLLLLTNDGEFKRQLELPSSGVVRSYRARAFGTISQAQLEGLAEGIEIEGMRYGSINANLERRTGRNCWIQMSLTEGKNREVRRVLEHLGLQVSRLIRTGYGPFDLSGMDPGDVAEVDRNQLAHFRRTLA